MSQYLPEITGVLGDIRDINLGGTQPSRHLMSPLGKDETGRASPVVATLPFDLYITGLIPHGDTTSDKICMYLTLHFQICIIYGHCKVLV